MTNTKPSTSYNSVHLSPRFFSHFFDWWSLFSGVMSLPIRQGSLWPGPEKSSKKFGRHLATIKYNLLFSPLYMAHIYKHKDAEDWSEDVVSATGLKLRLDSFMLDLHQRREHFATQIKGRQRPVKTSGMRINEAQVDFMNADVRAVSADITGTTSEDMKKATDETLAGYSEAVSPVDMSRFTIPDHDMSWIDMDDFVELDWLLPQESNPETKILPLAFAPRFTYFRQTDHGSNIAGDVLRSSDFGDEPTHFCVMAPDNDPRRVQCDLFRDRLSEIDQQIEKQKRALGEQELRVIRDSHDQSGVKEQFDQLSHQAQLLNDKRMFVQDFLDQLLRTVESQDRQAGLSHDGQASGQSDGPNLRRSRTGPDQDNSAPADDEVTDFNNRFIVHNVQLKWNNALRNIILRYIHQVSQRRGFVYYMSRRAVKFILDIVEEQNKAHQKGNTASGSDSTPRRSFQGPDDEDDHLTVQDRIDQIINDGKRFVDADDSSSGEEQQRPKTSDIGEDISDEFTAQKSYHVRLIAPQIQLQSEKNSKSALLVTGKGMELKVISIMDKHRVSDDVSGLVQRRFSLDMDGVQFFVTTQKHLLKFLHLYSGNRYGNAPGSAWPPWVSMEVMFDFELNPFGFSRVIQKTSASLRYDKYNTLRLKYNEEVGGNGGTHHDHPQATEDQDRRMDHLWVDFPHIRAICDSTQYYALYIIVMDLLLYSEPLEKVRSERLEKIMLATDFSDLRGAPQVIIRLQERIRQLEDIKLRFQIQSKYLDKQGWLDRMALEEDLASCEDELFFMMKAITTSQRKLDERTTSQTNGLLRWYLSASEIVWHLMREKDQPLLEFQLRKAAYERTDNSDGSNNNHMEIGYVHGLNLLPDAIYPDMVGPYIDESKYNGDFDEKMLDVHWYMLEAIAGIPVLDNFEVSLFPLKVQLERELGKKLFEYIFPGVGSGAFDQSGFSPFMVKNMRPLDAASDSEDDITEQSLSLSGSTPSIRGDDNNPVARAGALQLRLKPTRALPNDRPRSSDPGRGKKGLGITAEGPAEGHHFRFFQHSNHSNPHQPHKRALKRASTDSLKIARQSDNSSTTLSSMNGEKPRKFALRRSASNTIEKEKDKPSDDLTQMMTRASNYMTLAHVKVNSVVLCLSYKGKGERNIEDVHDFVFHMPALEYRNKTWSNLDLALQLKKDAIRALISHTGAIIGNKFSHHRPSKMQSSRLREIANSTVRLPNTDSLTNTSTTENGSIASRYSMDGRPSSPRRSFHSGPSPLFRSESFTPSTRSSTKSSIKAPDQDSIKEDPVAEAEEVSSISNVKSPSSSH